MVLNGCSNIEKVQGHIEINIAYLLILLNMTKTTSSFEKQLQAAKKSSFSPLIDATDIYKGLNESWNLMVSSGAFFQMHITHVTTMVSLSNE